MISNKSTLIRNILVCFLVIFEAFTQPVDTIKTTYTFSFRPQLTINYFSAGNENARIRRLNEQIPYRFQEFSLSGYVPVYERKFVNNDPAKDQRSLILLATGSLSRSRSRFTFLNPNPVVRISAGLRAIYYNGGKRILMASISPFISEETKLIKNTVPRFFAHFVYSRMVNENFSYRLGLTYTYLFNGGALLPLAGFRVGDYRKVFFNFQIPRDISLIWTINNHWQTGIFSRLSGGIYRFSVASPIQRLKGQTGNLILYRSDILTGIMVNYSPNNKYYFSLNAGVIPKRNLNLAFTNEFIPVRGHIMKDANGAPSGFINISMSIYFGKPTYNGSYNQLIEQKALNNSIDAGDLNLGNNQMTQDMNRVNTSDINKKDLKKINDQISDIKDLLLDE